MRLLLIRHAQAGQHDPNRWPDDSRRPITDAGRRVHRKVSRRLRRRDLIPDLLLTSPWTRALETAEITAEVTCRGGVSPTSCPALAEPPDLGRIAEAVGDADRLVALVGHEPWLGELASLLLTGYPDGVETDFPKSGVMGLELPNVTPDSAVLRFLLRPRGAY
jgi:phosphohistidine phosphatase